MPIIKSAQKKMRKDKKRTAHNAEIKARLKDTIKQARRNPSLETLKQMQSNLDKAVKTKFIHPNKAARLISRISKLTEPLTVQTKKSSAKKTSAKKTTPKKKS